MGGGRDEGVGRAEGLGIVNRGEKNKQVKERESVEVKWQENEVITQ